eukprot:Gb_11820 [translate_table: standard]
MEIAGLSCACPVVFDRIRNSKQSSQITIQYIRSCLHRQYRRTNTHFPRINPHGLGIGDRQAMPNHSMGRLHFMRHGDLFQTKDCSWLSMAGALLNAASALAPSGSGCRHFQMACISSAISMGSTGGGGGFGGTFDGNGGGGGGDGFKSHGGAARSMAGEPDDVTSTASGVIILDVGVIFLFL